MDLLLLKLTLLARDTPEWIDLAKRFSRALKKRLYARSMRNLNELTGRIAIGAAFVH